MNPLVPIALIPALAAIPACAAIARPDSSAQLDRYRKQAAQGPIRAAIAAATLEPQRGDFLNAMAVLPYLEGAIYRVHTAPERVTDLALQPGESLQAVASGDTVRWVIGDTSSGTGAARRVHVLVKPVSAGLSTNLVITTDRRAYHVTLSSSSGPAMAALSWSYPQDQLVALRRTEVEAAAAEPVAAGLDIDRLNFGYSISGDRPAWRPLRAFDDGRQTFIEFPPSLAQGEAPPLFLTDASGDVQLVNYRLRGRFYVVDRLFDTAELRLGLRKQQIVRIARSGQGGGRTRRRAP
ncbi:MAG: P-type conjugative transfer protein TrbG [Sphingomonas sp.]|nr:MAG: P-type conjugative transfer protein TrbG [Sphingomonas sp.]